MFGTRGWLKVYSYTRPPRNILTYPIWQLSVGGEWTTFPVIGVDQRGIRLVALLDGITDPTEAGSHIGAEIAVDREALPEKTDGEYYWADLVGVEVVNVEGIRLGRVSGLFDTGANDVLVVDGKKEHLIPFVRDHHVMDVDLERGLMTVDWHPDD